MTVPADEPTTGDEDGGGLGVPLPMAGGGAVNGSGGPVLPVVAGAEGDRDADGLADQAGEHELGASDGPVGGTPRP